MRMATDVKWPKYPSDKAVRKVTRKEPKLKSQTSEVSYEPLCSPPRTVNLLAAAASAVLTVVMEELWGFGSDILDRERGRSWCIPVRNRGHLGREVCNGETTPSRLEGM